MGVFVDRVAHSRRMKERECICGERHVLCRLSRVVFPSSPKCHQSGSLFDLIDLAR